MPPSSHVAQGHPALSLAAGDPPTNWSLPDGALVTLVAAGVGLLLVLVMKVRLHAFVALLLVSIVVAVAAGLPLSEIPGILQGGMGDTLGEIAIIVALGAMLGRMMEESGGARVLSDRLLRAFGERRAPLAVGLTALLFGIPVFIDVGFIIMLPLLYGVAARSGRSLLSVTLPAIGGLAIMHAVLPPHPGPVAAAGLLGANLGWIALLGLACGLPAWVLGAYLFGVRVGDRNFVPVPQKLYDEARAREGDSGTTTARAAPSLPLIVLVMVLPVLLIMLSTFAPVVLAEGGVRDALVFIGDPITALIVSALLSFYTLGLRRGLGMAQIERVAAASLGPVAMVLLVTGAGGVFGGVLEKTGAGDALADILGAASMPIVVLAFLIATALRVALGSKTVAIVTTAPIVAPLIERAELSQPETALIVIAIAAGGTVLSHVNDSGFWLMNRYCDLDMATTLRSWTLMETYMGGLTFVFAAAISGALALTG